MKRFCFIIILFISINTAYAQVNQDSLSCIEGRLLPINVNGNLCKDSSLILTLPDTLGLQGFQWFLGDGRENNDVIIEVIYSDVNIYTVSVEAFGADSCRYVGVEFIEIEDCTKPEDCNVIFPNAFTPNNDGRNDTFDVISNCTLQDFMIKIYNRWGQLVFEADDPNFFWNGEFSSKAAASDVYVWRASYRLPQQDSFIFASGDLTLIR
ncbi:MAG: gliding motility-associated C-terminal domain-containing protein [Saprospiraceae bacterium]|nr:gliding motility-associated C-terminal domain-containing protein [Saprospiraceae bacterium]